MKILKFLTFLCLFWIEPQWHVTSCEGIHWINVGKFTSGKCDNQINPQSVLQNAKYKYNSFSSDYWLMNGLDLLWKYELLFLLSHKCKYIKNEPSNCEWSQFDSTLMHCISIYWNDVLFSHQIQYCDFLICTAAVISCCGFTDKSSYKFNFRS